MLAPGFDAALAISLARQVQRIPREELHRARGDTMLFRGTLSWRELAVETKPGRVPWEGGGAVHRGFAELFEAACPAVPAPVPVLARGLRCPPPVRMVAGHSLGGVFAVLYALELARAGYAPPVVYTFGAPRLGDAALAARVARECRAFRVCNAPDLVPRLPPLCAHAGELVLVRHRTRSVLDNHALAALRAGAAGAVASACARPRAVACVSATQPQTRSYERDLRQKSQHVLAVRQHVSVRERELILPHVYVRRVERDEEQRREPTRVHARGAVQHSSSQEWFDDARQVHPE